jgi:hypothetical protein
VPWPTCQLPLCRCRTPHTRHLVTPAAVPCCAAVRLSCQGLVPSSSPTCLSAPIGHPLPPLFSWLGTSSAHPLSPLCLSVEATQVPPLPLAASVLPLLSEAAPRVTSSLLTAGSPSPSTKGTLYAGIVRWSCRHLSHGEHHRRLCHFALFLKLVLP